MKDDVINSIVKASKINKKEVEGYIEAPKDHEMGDYAFPCFSLAKKMKKNPSDIAKEIYSKLNKKGFEKVELKGPYINFFLDTKKLASSVMNKISKEGDDFGRSKRKGKVMVEYSQANTHKAFHIGHVKATSMGESIARIMEFSGNKVIRANYQGDTGMHIAKWIWCYTKYHGKHELEDNEGWIAGIYVDAIRRLNEKPELEEEVQKINKKLEEGKDKKLMDLWKKTRKLSLDAFEKIYKELNTRFDEYFFESEMEKRGKEISKDLLKRGIAEISDDATIIDFRKRGIENLGVWVLLRKDGTVLYSAKDIALAEKKFKEFRIDNAIYVVGNEQRLHIEQLFKTLGLMRFDVSKLRYIPVYEVRFPWGKMSSRTGDNVLYSDFKKELVDSVIKELEKRHDLDSMEIYERALAISIAAMKYTMLKQDMNKNVIFDKNEAMRFEGDTGPYLLYSYARALSIMEKAGYKKGKKIDAGKIEYHEKRLIMELNRFIEVVGKAYEELDPSIIANYAYNLARSFSEFYHNCKVIGDKNEQFRLELTDCFSQVLKNSLHLLGINAIRKM